MLRVALVRGLKYVWIDWSCMPQYSLDIMVEILRRTFSNKFYGSEGEDGKCLAYAVDVKCVACVIRKKYGGAKVRMASVWLV